MEIVEEGAAMVAKKKGELAIEDYLDFVDDRSLNLTIPQLRQQLLVDMVTTMDLMELHRSTLLDAGVSGDACFTLEEVINDLKDLDWQECHVTSLLTFGAAVSASSSTSSDATASGKRKRRKSLRRKTTEVGAEHSDISTGTTGAAESTTESLRSVEV
ncbi:hypothetical protein Salat_1211600 [Sesamum alatum]|uniref:Uncharacterized protein n=1 Tax=Sesamum alatum TaxID=300844 RepID=A0AAE1YFC4_9LAMI|nr:hypothetical protein Salat_1211600 [Sesamum alatum]